MPFPSSWAEALIGKLSVRYGESFTRQYANLDPEAVKADWCEVLDGYEKHPDAITYALKYLSADRPPNAAQFRELCRKAPAKEEPRRLTHSGAKPRAEVMAKLAELGERLRTKPQNPKAWIADLKARIASGYVATDAQLRTLAQAEREVYESIGDGGGFTPIPRHLWPEAMQREL